jgi:hypothetical protein
MLVTNITEMMIFNKWDQFVPQHTIYGMEISSVWMFVKSTLVKKQVEPIFTSTHNIWNGNFFCVDVCEEHLSDEYPKLAYLQFGGGGEYSTMDF